MSEDLVDETLYDLRQIYLKTFYLVKGLASLALNYPEDAKKCINEVEKTHFRFY